MATSSLPLSTEQPSVLNRWLARAYTVNWVAVAYAAILVLAIFTRFFNLGARVMSHDESLHTYYSYRLFSAGDFQHSPLMHGPILFHVTALFYFLFGDNDFTARLYPAILGVILVMMPILFRRWLGKWGMLLASVMFLISPLLMYYNRYIREDTPSIVSALLMMYAILMYVSGPEHLRRRARWLYLLAAALIWNLGTKESGFIYVAIFGSYVTLYWVVRLYQEFRHVPSRRLFNFLGVGVLLGTVAALAMTMVFSISLSNFTSSGDRMAYLGTQISGLLNGQAPGFEFVTFVSWTLLVIGVIVAIAVGTALWATRRGGRLQARDIVLLLLVALVVCLALVAFEEITQHPARADTEVTTPDGTNGVSVAGISYLPIIADWVVSVVAILVLVYARVVGWWRKLYRFAEFDVLIVLGTLILPWLAPIVIKMTGADPTDYSGQGIRIALEAVIPFLALSLAAGLLWNWKRWLICALVFYIPFAFFFTTMFTNPVGLASGMIGSLGYWLIQQGVQRGSQPRYYYALVIMPVYEYLPLIGGFLAMLSGMTLMWRGRLHRKRKSADTVLGSEIDDDALAIAPEPEVNPRQDPDWLKQMPFILFFAWSALFNFLAYTLAGEKMPWLGVHLTLPLIMVTAWYFGRVFAQVDWAAFRWRGWLYLVLLPLLGIAVFQAIAPFAVGDSPFKGLERQQLADFYQWLAVIGVAVLVIALIVMVARRTGMAHFRRMVGVTAFAVLALLTFRHAWMASFINYDYANEYLVYAHGAPGIKLMMSQIEDISRRTTDGMNIKFAWGGNAWPVTWYFRHLTNATFFAGNPSPGAIGDAVAVYASDDIRARVEPLLEDRYYRFEYIRMWWPDQEYFYLTAQRVTNAFDFSSDNTQAAQIRRGMFDIWWKRDYSQYGQAIGKDYSLENWPVSEHFFLYIRKDVAAQVWNLGVGDAVVQTPLEGQVTSVCTDNWQQQYGNVVFGAEQNLTMNRPLGIAVDDSGNHVYVAEESNNRVSEFTKDGLLVTTLQGGTGDFVDAFNRPNGVAVGPNGNLYVADTWNYRIREFSPDGALITSWGQAGQYGADAQTDPKDGFWGPRDVAVDAQGNVYVADTGNKRVRVYTANGDFIRDIGSAGSGLGQLNEPVGLAIDSENQRLYVADTWNQRVAVFGLDGTPQSTFKVRGWYEDLGNRPYMAIDQTRNLLYVTDPDAGRILVYDLQGNCVGSFGQPSDTPTDNSQFKTIGGIATDAEGNVYVDDASVGRVIKFAPFVDTVMPEPTEEIIPANDLNQATEQVLPANDANQATEERLPVTEEATPEIVG